MVRLTMEDVIKLNNVIIGRVAEVLNIDVEKKEITQVFAEIAETKDPIYDMLLRFIDLYMSYQQQIDDMEAKELKTEILSDDEQEELKKRINSRNNSRLLLIQEIENRLAK